MTQRKFSIVLLLAAAAVCLFLASCSEAKKDLPSQLVVSNVAHPTTWGDTANANFHGKILKASTYSFDSCVKCHGATYSGGASGQSCYQCHGSFPHGSGWTQESSAEFHGKFVKALHYDVTTCKPCHGQNFSGGTSNVSCAGADCHSSAYPHSTGWDVKANGNFHGTYVRTKSYSTTDCTPCHGSDLLGGSSGVSCKQCHAGYPHIANWTNPVSTSYHGAYLKSKNYNAAECTSCHGSDFKGDGVSAKSCLTCHPSYPHDATWLTSGSPQSHGQYLKTNSWTSTECQACHGSDYLGGTSSRSCFTCHPAYPHNASWLIAANTQSHGQFVKAKSWNSTECKLCHGSDYAGGATSESCFTCHPTYPHVVNMETAHLTTLRNANYPLASCQVCHGVSYGGGAIVDVSCTAAGCHRDVNGSAKSPESCNVCHGSFTAFASDKMSWAPPVALNNDSLTTSAGVGAHQKHLTTAGVGRLVKCEECHTVPATWNAAGHLNPLPFRAEVVFQDTLAKLMTSGGAIVPNPSYDGTALACANTYCHGNWRLRKATSTVQFVYADTVIVGGNASPVWTASAACGTCHGLPPTGHTAATLTTCVNCHSGMIDATGTITDKTKHVNGKINVFGQERPML